MAEEITINKLLNNFDKINKSQWDSSVNMFAKNLATAVLEGAVVSFKSDITDVAKKAEAVFNYFEVDEDDDKEKIYYIGKIQAIIDIAALIADNIEENNVEDFSGYKYVHNILEILIENGMTTQGNISNRLQIDSHSVSNTMRRVKDYGLWNTRKFGRNVFYSITEKGRIVYRKNKEKGIAKNDVSMNKLVYIVSDKICEQMSEYNPDVNKIVRDINSEMGFDLLRTSYCKHKIQNVFNERNNFVEKSLGSYLEKRNDMINKKYKSGDCIPEYRKKRYYNETYVFDCDSNKRQYKEDFIMAKVL